MLFVGCSTLALKASGVCSRRERALFRIRLLASITAIIIRFARGRRRL